MRYRAHRTSLVRRAAAAAAAALGLMMLTAPGPAGAGAASVKAGTWGRAIQVPGTAALEGKGGSASVGQISCASPGNCSAGGSYSTTGPGNSRAFVVSQVQGRWGKAQQVPGMPQLNRGLAAGIGAMSCPSAGNCAGGGSYTDRAHHAQAFVVSQVHGKWGKAIEVRGTAALNTGGRAGIDQISCPSAGNCTAAGSYIDPAFRQHVFVVSQVHGKWGRARQVPGLEALNAGSDSMSLSCASAGNCSAGGVYQTSGQLNLAFVASQVHGKWGRAQPAPGAGALTTDGYVAISAVSCGSPGNCTAGGLYTVDDGERHPFLITQAHGSWGQAFNVPGMAALGDLGAGLIDAISCPSAGNCTAGGTFGRYNGLDAGGGGQALVITEKNGTWGNALVIPGSARLNSAADAAVESLSCATPGNCAATGYYGIGQPGNKDYNLELFVASQVNGTWDTARQIPGTAALNQSHWALNSSVSCPAPSRCSASGSYSDRHSAVRAFVVSQS